MASTPFSGLLSSCGIHPHFMHIYAGDEYIITEYIIWNEQITHSRCVQIQIQTGGTLLLFFLIH